MGDPFDAADKDADASFGTGTVADPVQSCTPAPGGSGTTPPPAPAWTAADIKKNLDACDGGTGVWAAAKAAPPLNGAKDPTIVEGASVIGTGASSDCSTGTVTIDPGQDKCTATQLAVFELTNLSNCADFNKIGGPDCASGSIGRHDFIWANEGLEYQAVKNSLTAFDACKSTWGCPASATCNEEYARSAKDFNDYYYNYLNVKHKKYWGDIWDRQCKGPYDKKHPPPPPPPAPAPAPRYMSTPDPAAGSTEPAPPGTQAGGAADSDDSDANNTATARLDPTVADGSPAAPVVRFSRESRDDVIGKARSGSDLFESYWTYYDQISPDIEHALHRGWADQAAGAADGGREAFSTADDAVSATTNRPSNRGLRGGGGSRHAGPRRRGPGAR
jgi:hypothetical protein